MVEPRFFICLFLLTLPHISDAQKIVRVENVVGEWIISDDITGLQAKENALREAKAAALRKAGVPERFSESTILYKVEDNNKYSDFFESITTSDVSGEISSFEIVREQKLVRDNNQVVYSVLINADITINKTAKDPSFKCDVVGLRENYFSPDKLAFDVNPWEDGYLTVFILSQAESGQLFPNATEKQALLKGGQKYSFPKSKFIDYEVSTAANVEVNYILLVFTKQEVKFRDEPTDKNILKFVASLNPAEKYVKTFSISIKKGTN